MVDCMDCDKTSCSWSCHRVLQAFYFVTEVEWTRPVLRDCNPDSSLNLSGLPKFAFLCVPEANKVLILLWWLAKGHSKDTVWTIQWCSLAVSLSKFKGWNRIITVGPPEDTVTSEYCWEILILGSCTDIKIFLKQFNSWFLPVLRY